MAKFRCRNKNVLLIVLVLWLLKNYGDITQAQQTHGYLSGSIRDETTGEPIPLVNVFLLGTYYGAATDREGNFIIQNLSPGDYVVVVRHVAYHQTSRIVTVDVGMTTTIQVSLLGRTIPLEEIEIVGESSRFGLSRGALGRVVSKKEISRYPNATFTQLLQAVIPTTRVREEDGNLVIELVRASSIYQRYGRLADSNPLIILNGTKIGTVTSHLNYMLRSQEIERMEVITGPSALLYGSEGRNGVIIIDTARPVADSQLDNSFVYFIGAVAAFLLFYFLIP